MTLTVLSLFSGIGGLDRGFEQAGFEVIAQSEIEPYCCKVLEKHWPGVPNLGDITKIDWNEVRLMGAHRNNELAEKMYDSYCQGLSCAEVAALHGRSRQTVWKMFERRGWDLRERPPARPTVAFAGRLFSLGYNGYYVATEGDRAYLHRVVWWLANGPIPADWDVHHLNHDKTDNRLANLQALPKADHTRLHQEVVPGESSVDLICGGYP